MTVLTANIWPRRPTPAATEQTRAAGLALRRPVPPLVTAGRAGRGARPLGPCAPASTCPVPWQPWPRDVRRRTCHPRRPAALSILSQEGSEEVLASVKPGVSSRALAAGCCRTVEYRR